MRRRMLVVLLILGIAILAARDFANRSPARTDPPGREIRFLQFNSLDPLLGSPLAELQNSIDGISEAALRGHWFTASREQEELERIWLELKSQKKAGLEIEQEITR
ncbi:MAG: hypothetical protein GX335_08805, partial [Firmicutes bacterium]|nr:hypothetical protein [Bacillota bacterium]